MQRKVEAPEFLVQQYDLAFLMNDRAAMDRAVSLAHGDSEAESRLDGHQAFVHAYSGQMREAATATQRAVAIAQQSGERERAAQFKAAEALWNGFFGDAVAAKRAAGEALELSRARDIEYGAAVALALASDSARAEALARYQIARAYAMAGDPRRAKSAYEDVLALWKGSDPDIPIVKQARAEYAALR